VDLSASHFSEVGSLEKDAFFIQIIIIILLVLYLFVFNFSVDEGTECAICLDFLKLDDKIKVLPDCRHKYHATCINQWIRQVLH
jgi:hypothetical protein